MNDAASLSDDLDYRLLFESSPDLYLILNEKLQIVAASNAYTSATLTRREEILGKTMFEVFPDNPNDPTAEGQKNLRASQQRVLLSGKPDTMPVQKYDIPRPDGNGFEERYWSPMHIPILGNNGRVAYIIHRAEDLTDFIRIKQQGIAQSQLNETLRAQAVKMEVELFARSKEIASTSAELKAANDELSRLYAKTLELDELKTQFFANVSHEFRTPLTLMIGPLEDLLTRFAPKDLPPTDEYEQLSLVHRNSLRLLKLVNSLLDFSRIEAGRMDVAYEAVDLAAYTAELASLFRSATDKVGLTLVVSCPTLPEPVYVDRQMWEKIVINLLSNAYKHTFEGEIEVALRWCGKSVELLVRDTGVGIAEDQLAHVFDRFHRVQNVRARTHEGSGIGLALVQELVRLHGGDVRVTSTPGVGSTFTVSILTGTDHLRAEQIHPGQEFASHATGVHFFVDEASRWEFGTTNETDKQIGVDPSNGLASHTDSHIILADDNADMRTYVSRLLQEQGYTVTAVRDGEEALTAVREHHPDLVLTDIMMPHLDGIGLLCALREDQGTSTIPIILLSARAGEDERIRGLEHRADGYLTKPFSTRELLAHVGACLAVSRLRKETENQLRFQEAEREFRTLAETMPQIVWATRADGWNTYFNQQWVEYTGLTLEESYGHGWNIPFHPDDKQRAWEAWQRATQHNEIYSLECRLRRHDGVYRWWLIRGVPLLNEQGEVQKWYGTCTDIQDLKEADIAIRESEQRLHFALEMCNTGAWEVDLETHAVYRSIEHARIFGYTDLTSTWSLDTFLAHVLAEDQPKVSALLEEAFNTGGEQDFECRIRRTDGEIRWIRLAGRYRTNNTDGKGLVAVGIVQDITESKLTQEELKQHRDQLEILVASRTAELEQAKALADAANRSKSAFLASMSHEIRTPLNAVIGFSDLLRKQSQLPEQALLINKINFAGKHLLGVINDILDFSKIEANQIKLESNDFELATVIDTVTSMLANQTESKALRLIVEIDPLLVSCVVMGDSLRLGQILLNLTSNAIKFTEAGSITLRTRLESEQDDRLLIRFEVQDTGLGISEEQQSRLFQAFEQAESSTTRKFGGTGLGLAISKKLAELMGGSIGVDSRIGAGSTFWFTAWLARGHLAKSAIETTANDTAEHQLQEKYAGYRLLIAEDDEFNRMLAELQLKETKLILDFAENGLQAVEKARSSHYDVILMDMQMPEMNGIEATMLIRQLPGYAKAPIIAMTANAFSEDRQRCLDAGMNDHIAKPVKPEVLYQKLLTWLGNS